MKPSGNNLFAKKHKPLPRLNPWFFLAVTLAGEGMGSTPSKCFDNLVNKIQSVDLLIRHRSGNQPTLLDVKTELDACVKKGVLERRNTVL
jgi:hypothetical protein